MLSQSQKLGQLRSGLYSRKPSERSAQTNFRLCPQYHERINLCCVKPPSFLVICCWQSSETNALTQKPNRPIELLSNLISEYLWNHSKHHSNKTEHITGVIECLDSLMLEKQISYTELYKIIFCVCHTLLTTAISYG